MSLWGLELYYSYSHLLSIPDVKSLGACADHCIEGIILCSEIHPLAAIGQLVRFSFPSSNVQAQVGDFMTTTMLFFDVSCCKVQTLVASKWVSTMKMRVNWATNCGSPNQSENCRNKRYLWSKKVTTSTSSSSQPIWHVCQATCCSKNNIGNRDKVLLASCHWVPATTGGQGASSNPALQVGKRPKIELYALLN